MRRKIILIDVEVKGSKELISFRPIWNIEGAKTLYTLNSQNPLDIDQSNATEGPIYLDRSGLIRFTGAKIGSYPSPVYEQEVHMADKMSRAKRPESVYSEYSLENQRREDIYSNTAWVKMSDGVVMRSRYFPSSKLKDIPYKTIKITGDLRDRIDLIAYDYLGDSQLWWIIAEMNREEVTDPMNIPVNTYLRIPNRDWIYKKGYLKREVALSELNLIL